MMKTPRERKLDDANMSAKELASYEWEGMGNKEGRALFEGSESIKVTVGTESNQKTWYLPKKVLTHCSPFFNAALNGDFVEASSKAVSLPEDDPAAFELWATWLSLGKREDLLDHIGREGVYVRAWMLGDKLACPAFKDHVMVQLVDWWENGGNIQNGTIHLVYDGSSPGSQLRRFFVDKFVWDKMRGNLEDEADEYIALLKDKAEFLEDSARQEMEAGKDSVKDPWEERHRYYENPLFEF